MAGLPVGSDPGSTLGPDPDTHSRRCEGARGPLQRGSILRLVCDLVEAELAASGSRAPGTLPDRSLWHSGTRIREGVVPDDEVVSPGPGLALDSLDLLLVASRVNQFFHMQEWALGEHLVRYRTFGTWAQVAHVALTDSSGAEAWPRLTFASSGSTGRPKEIPRERQDLEDEVDYLRSRLTGVRRVISLVPAHHLYGFLWTVLLPDRAGWETLDARFWSPGRMRSELRPGDLIVGFPLRWKVLLRTLDRVPPGVTGVSSAGALEPELWATAAERGLDRLIEIYGSTETGGAGWREQDGEPYESFPRWRVAGRDLSTAAMDRLEWTADGRFFVLGRKDRAVKVGGELVDLSAVEDLFKQHEQVADCAVRLDGPAATARLRAFVVPVAGADISAESLSTWARDRLTAAATPRQIQFGAHLPRNSQGKVIGW